MHVLAMTMTESFLLRFQLVAFSAIFLLCACLFAPRRFLGHNALYAGVQGTLAPAAAASAAGPQNLLHQEGLGVRGLPGYTYGLPNTTP